jgi:hypothetical protein
VKEAEAQAEEVRKKERESDGLPYRPIYNLACYEVALASLPPGARAEPSSADGRSRSGHLQEALRLLKKAFTRASPSQRRDLVDWAGHDPSLEILRTDTAVEFTELRQRFGASRGLQKASPDTTE